MMMQRRVCVAVLSLYWTGAQLAVRRRFAIASLLVIQRDRECVRSDRVLPIVDTGSFSCLSCQLKKARIVRVAPFAAELVIAVAK